VRLRIKADIADALYLERSAPEVERRPKAAEVEEDWVDTQDVILASQRDGDRQSLVDCFAGQIPCYG
jgi:hypothetical protein